MIFVRTQSVKRKRALRGRVLVLIAVPKGQPLNYARHQDSPCPAIRGALSRRASLQLAAQTVLGSAKLLIESGQHPGMLKDGVTSPGGTAIAGLHTLEAGGLRNVLMNAVEAATRRSRELGEEFLRKL